jgi:hypothetical protein
MEVEGIKNLSIGNIHITLVEGLGIVIGTLMLHDDLIFIEKPRVVQTVQLAEGRTEMRFANLIGNPELVYLIRSPIFIYEPTELKLVNTYKEVVSPIKIVPASGLKVLKGGNGGIVNDIS